MPSSSSHLLLFLLLGGEVWSYEAPRDKQDVFAGRACPSFLSFTSAAYLAGVTVELPCHCKPPQVQSVLWFFRKHLGSSEETVALSYHRDSQVPHSDDLRSRFSIRLFSLLIFRTGPDDSGIYICGSASKDFFYGFDLDVQEARRVSVTSRLDAGGTSQRLTETRGLGASRPLYRVFTSFQPWAVCDRCGVRGEQVRVGLCYIHSQFLHVRYRRANQTVASCGSGAVPRAFGGLKQSRVEAKLEVRSCQVTCPPRPPPSSKLLTLMAFLGIRSSASMPVEVPVFYLNHPAGRVLTLGCPGARADMAVAWDQGSEPIYRSEHLAEASRRQIDAGHHLVFKPAELQDTGLYCCWLQGRQAAQIRLLVYVHLGRGQSVTSHPDFLKAVKIVMISYAAMTTAFLLLVVIRAAVRVFRDAAQTHVE